MPTRSHRAGKKPGTPPSANHTALLTLDEVLSELKVARSTFYGWLQYGRGPKCIRYPNKQIRVRRSDLDAWLASQEVDA